MPQEIFKLLTMIRLYFNPHVYIYGTCQSLLRWCQMKHCTPLHAFGSAPWWSRWSILFGAAFWAAYISGVQPVLNQIFTSIP